MTKDLSYSIFTLKPKDKREAEIYYQYRLKDVSELYAYFLAMVILLPIVDGIEFYIEKTKFSFFAMLYTTVVTAIRFFAHCNRDRYPGL